MADSSETRVNKLLPTTAELEKSILALQALARHIAAGVRADMDTYAKLNALGGSDVDSATGLDEIRLANEESKARRFGVLANFTLVRCGDTETIDRLAAEQRAFQLQQSAANQQAGPSQE